MAKSYINMVFIIRIKHVHNKYALYIININIMEMFTIKRLCLTLPVPFQKKVRF